MMRILHLLRRLWFGRQPHARPRSQTPFGNAIAGEPLFRWRDAGRGPTRTPGNGVAGTRAFPNGVWKRGCNFSRRWVSGRVGVPPAVLGVPPDTRRTSLGVASSSVLRQGSARRGTRRARRPPYPRPIARFRNGPFDFERGCDFRQPSGLKDSDLRCVTMKLA